MMAHNNDCLPRRSTPSSSRSARSVPSARSRCAGTASCTSSASSSPGGSARRRASRPGSTLEADRRRRPDLLRRARRDPRRPARLDPVLRLQEVLADPLMILRIWEGGMSFHGGLVGVMIAVAIFAARRGRRIADVFDFIAPLPGSGIFAGRIGNFINGELWGKPTDVPWGFIVDPAVLHPMQAAEARRLCERFAIDPCVLHVHASQLYEGLLEGLLLFGRAVVFTREAAAAACALRAVPALLRRVPFRRGVRARAGRESRLPAFGWVTMGQMLSLPMIIAGLVLLALGLSLQPAERQPCRLADRVNAAVPRPAAAHARARRSQDRSHRHRHAVGVRLSDALRPGAGFPLLTTKSCTCSRSSTSCCGS